MAKPQTVPIRFGPHETFPGIGLATGRPAFVDDLVPFGRGPEPGCISIDVGTILTLAVLSAAGGNFCFTDTTLALTNVVLQNFARNDHIDVIGASADDYNFARSFDDINDLIITYSDPASGVLTRIVIDDVLPDTGAVNNLASAIAAVGFDFISFECLPVSIDVGTVLSAEVLDAAGADFCFDDSAAVTTNVILQNFASGDRIDVTGASATDYNFARSFDDANDLVITFSTGPGATNRIVIDDVLPDTGGVTNYASAVSLIGYDFMTFA